MAKSKKNKTTSTGALQTGTASDASAMKTNVSNGTIETPQAMETTANGSNASVNTTQATEPTVTADLPADLTSASAEPETIGASPYATENATTGNDVALNEEAISRRAYEIYLERNGTPGNPLQDWQRAERELRAK